MLTSDRRLQSMALTHSPSSILLYTCRTFSLDIYLAPALANWAHFAGDWNLQTGK